ncbi:MAG TPA: DNA-formamidopyrimidine glycosylase family protein [Vicinamibacterales bacterium]|nr:DNA-formamidopyrimidine glycosylase family protein [Vicinamibacterales bacterium]
MPEGDTIFRAARTLHRALAGLVITAFESQLSQLVVVDRRAPIAGRSVDGVTARGKHLLIALSGDLVLRSHMRMNGSWHIYRP